MSATQSMTRQEPTPIAAWIRGRALAWYCQRCEAWHLNSHNRNEPEPVLRWPPAGCGRRGRGQMQLVIRGEADIGLEIRIEENQPPEWYDDDDAD